MMRFFLILTLGISLASATGNGTEQIKDKATSAWNAAKTGATKAWRATKQKVSDVKQSETYKKLAQSAKQGWTTTKQKASEAKEWIQSTEMYQKAAPKVKACAE